MTEQLLVTKRDGKTQQLDLNKIHRVLEWAVEDLKGVSVSAIEMQASLNLYSKIKTTDIHDILVNSAKDLITEDAPAYQYVAARLQQYKLRKDVCNGIEVPSLSYFIRTNIDRGVYDTSLIEKYTEAQITQLNNELNHERDFALTYIGSHELVAKYLVKNKVTGQIFETPQIAFMVLAMTMYANEESTQKLAKVKNLYKKLSNFEISLPTPIMAGLRTQVKQFSSCVLLDCGDSINSITTTSTAMIKYVTQKAGIGLNVGRIRAVKSPIRNGDAYHTGLVPFIKKFEHDIGCCSQGGIRKGSATLFFPVWHLEVEELIVLKNDAGEDENRARGLDYAVQFNDYLLKRMLKKGNKITLFSPDLKDLYEAYFTDQEKFIQLYEKYENDPKITKKQIDADVLLSNICIERLNTGRIYAMFVDNLNNGPFRLDKAPIFMSNLCMEILLPTKPLQDLDDSNGQISLCTLGGINLGQLKQLSDLEEICDTLVRGLDNILDYQNYPIKAAEEATKKYRPLGIGVINFAYYLAKHGLKYDDKETLSETHKLFEAIQYYCLKASNKLAKERGKFPGWEDSKYSQGLLPIDWYKKSIDEYCPNTLQLDWETLRKDIQQYGLRNATLTAQFPSESSSRVSAATSGIEPVRGYIVGKPTKDGAPQHISPNFKKLKEKYTIAWDLDSKDMIKIVSIIQKFFDQSVSANTYTNPTWYEDGNIPMKVLKEHMRDAARYGVKTLYYNNKFVPPTKEDGGKSQQEEDMGCEGGACAL